MLHLGGGAWTLPRYVAATRPARRQQVVELDGALVELVHTRLPADGLDLDVRIADARSGLAAAADGTWDVVVLDVFAGARIPAHLTSVEFLRQVAGALAPGGVYVANLADGAGGRRGAGPSGAWARLRRAALAFARSQVATAAAVFGEVAVVAAPEVLHGRRFGNLVLMAGGRHSRRRGGPAGGGRPVPGAGRAGPRPSPRTPPWSPTRRPCPRRARRAGFFGRDR